MKFFYLFFMMTTISFSATLGDVIGYYKNSDFQKSCKEGKKFLSSSNVIVSMVGDACAKADDINILGDIIKHLNKTAADRTNASYFATLILEKKLIYQFMNDRVDIANLVLPKTSHILSRVFEKLSKKDYKVDKTKVVIKDGIYKYILFLNDDKPRKLYIFEYKNNKLIKKHLFV